VAKEDYLIEPAAIGVGGGWPFEINLLPLCARRWQGDEYVEVGEIVLPTKGNGYAAQCLTAGTTAHLEPPWPDRDGLTKKDGSATWTMIPADDNGIDVATTPTQEVAPAGLTVNDLAVVEGRKLVGYYSASSASVYVVRFGVMINGLQRYARQQVEAKLR
jgi:hypothetical protein